MSFLKQLTTRGNPFENPAVSFGSLANPEAWMNMWGSTTESGEAVTPELALNSTTVVSCVRLISEGMGQLPLRVTERLARGYRVAFDHQYYDMLATRWNPEMTATLAQMVSLVHCLLWGACYIEIQRDNGGRVAALWPRKPWQVQVKRDGGGNICYEYREDNSTGQSRRIDAADCIFVPGLSLDGLTGTPTVSYARSIIGLALALDRHGSRYFSQGMNTTGTFEVPGELSDKAYARMKDSMERQTTGANRFRALILEAGVKFQSIENKNDSGQFTETRKAVQNAICSVFRVPTYMVDGDSGRGVKSNSAQQAQDFITFCLMPWIFKFQQEMSYKIFPSMGRTAGKYEVRYHVDALMASDATARMTYYAQGRQNGLYTANECRVLEGMEPVGEEGDILLSPLNFSPAQSLLTIAPVDPSVVAADANEDEDEDRSHPLLTSLVTRINSTFSPLFADAFARLNNRSKRDTASIRQCLKPSLEAASSSLRDMLATTNNIEVGDEHSNKAIDKYLTTVEGRTDALDVPAFITRAIRTLTYSAYQDLASAQAETQLKEVQPND